VDVGVIVGLLVAVCVGVTVGVFVGQGSSPETLLPHPSQLVLSPKY
jgi:hypothetical protein